MEKFSVLMSVYIKEKAEYLRVCLDSILENTVVPNEIVIVKDGPLTEELETTLCSDVAHFVYTQQEICRAYSLERQRDRSIYFAKGLFCLSFRRR